MRAAIFDFDGVLVDSEPLHYEALRLALVPEGIEVSEEEYALFYLAYNDREGARIAFERHDLPFDAARVEAVATRKAAAFESLMSGVPFFPGAKELVRALAEEVPVAIASGALRREIEQILAGGGLRDAFSIIVGADDVSRGKPDPEPYLAALAGLAPLAPGITAGDCVVIEDSMPGIVSARAAGMRVVAVTHSYPATRLGAAHQVVDSLAGLGPAELRSLFTPSPA